RHPFRDHGVHFLAPLEPPPGATEARVLAELRTADGRRQGTEELVAGDRDDYPAVARPVAVVGGRGEVAIADARRLPSGGREGSRPVVEEREHPVLTRDVDHLLAPGRVPRDDRGEDADRAEEPLHVVAERTTTTRRGVFGK